MCSTCSDTFRNIKYSFQDLSFRQIHQIEKQMKFVLDWIDSCLKLLKDDFFILQKIRNWKNVLFAHLMLVKRKLIEAGIRAMPWMRSIVAYTDFYLDSSIDFSPGLPTKQIRSHLMVQFFNFLLFVDWWYTGCFKM